MTWLQWYRARRPQGRRRWTLGLVAIVACRAKPTAAGWSPSFRPELLARLAQDQVVRDTFLAEINRLGQPTAAAAMSMQAVDSANLAWLKPRLQRFGWPTRANLDSESIEAVFLLVQHADRDPAFQALMLPQLQAAHRAGEIDGQSLALLTDRVAKAQGRPQEYGTQTTFRGREAVVDPIADSANVDARRAELGLPPLAVYKHMLDSMVASAGAH